MKMDLNDFKSRVQAATDESEIDEFCISWLNLLAMDNGKEGEIAQQLIGIIKKLLLS